MNDGRLDLNRLKIATPCSVGWDNMQGDAQVRHCGTCELNVYNLAEITADKARRLISAREGRLCLRLYRRADGTVITKDCPVGLRAYRKRVARVAGATLTAILGLFSVSYGQKTEPLQPSKEKIIKSFGNESLIKGVVTDSNGGVIANAQVTVINSENVELFSVKTDADGLFKTLLVKPGIYTVVISSQWFQALRIEAVEVKIGEIIDITAPLKVNNEGELLGILVEESAPIERMPDLLNLPEVAPRPQPKKKKPRV